MVTMSYWPPLVAIPVVTFWRSTFSSSVTHCSLMSGFFAVKSSVSFCMRIMSPLFTVAMVRVEAARAEPESNATVSAPNIIGVSFIDVLPTSKASNCFGDGQFLNSFLLKSSAGCMGGLTHVHQMGGGFAENTNRLNALAGAEQFFRGELVGDQP